LVLSEGISTSLWNDETLQTVHSNARPLMPKESVYIKIVLQQQPDDDQYLLQVMSCWSSPYATLQSGTKRSLISDGYVVNDTATKLRINNNFKAKIQGAKLTSRLRSPENI